MDETDNPLPQDHFAVLNARAGLSRCESSSQLRRDEPHDRRRCNPMRQPIVVPTTGTTLTRRSVAELRNAHDFAQPAVFRDVVIQANGTVRRDRHGPGKFNCHPRTGCGAVPRECFLLYGARKPIHPWDFIGADLDARNAIGEVDHIRFPWADER